MNLTDNSIADSCLVRKQQATILTMILLRSKIVIEFYDSEKMTPLDIHGRLRNVNGSETITLGPVRQWMIYLTSCKSGVCDKLGLEYFIAVSKHLYEIKRPLRMHSQ